MVVYRAVPSRSIWRSAFLPKTGLAIVAGLSTGLLLSPPIFHSAAVVGSEGGLGAMSTDALRTASELALSRSVLLHAADRLRETSVNSTNAQASQLADQIRAMLRTAAGPDGTLSLSADALEPMQAARVATTVAEALVAQREAMIADTRRVVENATTSRVAALRASAVLAHRHLATLAGVDPGSAQVRTSATLQVSAADARVTELRAIIASGMPPLADSKDVPQSVETLQTTYLDLTRKLALARGTLGDRHSTIIALQDSVRRAGAALTVEWKRLLRIAEADLAAAKQREASFGTTAAAPDIAHQAAIDIARRAARDADDAVVQAESQGALAANQQGYRLISPAPVPLTFAAGWSPLYRVFGSLLAALATFALASLVFARRRLAPFDSVVEMMSTREPSFAVEMPPAPPTSLEDHVFTEWHAVAPPRGQTIAAVTRTDLPAFVEAEAKPLVRESTTLLPVSPPDQETDLGRRADPAQTPSHVQPSTLSPELQEAFMEIVNELASLTSVKGAVPSIMVAANEMCSGTTTVALHLASVAVERGMRVLLVEGPRERPQLAGAAEADGEPVLAELFGSLRVVLRSERSDALFLAPLLKNGPDLVEALVRNEQAILLEQLESEFDIMVIDGGRAADSAAAGLEADRYLRTGALESRDESERFLETFDADPAAFVGTLTGSNEAQKPTTHDTWRPAPPQLVETSPEPVISPARPTRPTLAPVATRPAYPRRAASR